MSQTKIKPIALYLPQYHPIPENDEWWGKGFTEWTNVTKAKPLFEDHYQPHLPADLGFYDLRLEEARLAQESMAKQYGIYGFCYYHYWFNGKRLLFEPLDRKLKNKTEDLPFILCWANENWTRAWDGMDKEVLLRQEFNIQDDLDHIRFLCRHFFTDDRYIKVNGKPAFIFYRPQLFPDIENTLHVWREEAMKCGVGELHLGYFQSFNYKIDPKETGFDFAVEFQPDFANLPENKPLSFVESVKYALKMQSQSKRRRVFFDYEEFSKQQLQKKHINGIYPCITPMWDNSARRKINPFILHDSTPEKYGKWLARIRDEYPWQNSDANFLFINAWNEWAEGNHLEPCQKWGREYLEETAKILNNNFSDR